jgi:hypothetical protein
MDIVHLIWIWILEEPETFFVIRKRQRNIFCETRFKLVYRNRLHKSVFKTNVVDPVVSAKLVLGLSIKVSVHANYERQPGLAARSWQRRYENSAARH